MSQSRVKQREQVFCLLFSAQFSKDSSAEEILSAAAESAEISVEEFGEYVRETFVGALAFSQEALALVEENARGWSLARMSPVMRALLILSVYEILKTPIAVSIAANEAVELCKRYEDERGAGFLNGILGTISRTYAMEKLES